MRTFIENYLHFIKNCIRPPYKKLKTLKSGFIENSNSENNRDPCTSHHHHGTHQFWSIRRFSHRWFWAIWNSGPSVYLRRIFFTHRESPPLPLRWERVREFGVLQGFVATKLDLGREYKESFFAGVLPGSVSQPCALLSSSWERGKADAWDVTLRFQEYLRETR